MSQELYIAEITMSKRLAERRQQIRRYEEKRLARRQHQGWLSQQGCRLLCHLGNLLVGWGERLRQSGLPPSMILKGDPTRGS